MKNLIEKKLVMACQNNKHGRNEELWREHKDEFFSYFDICPKDNYDDSVIICDFFTENIPIGIDIYEMLTKKDIFKEVSNLEKEYHNLDIAGFNVSVSLIPEEEIKSITIALTLQDGSFFVDTLLNDVICLEDLFLEKVLQYCEERRESNLMHIKLLIDQMITDPNITDKDKEDFLNNLIERTKKLGGEK